jgi:hypothetical protein
VERPNWQAAFDELLETIRGYVQDACEAGVAPKDVRRPVPMSERRYIYWQLAMGAIKQFVATLIRPGGRDRPGKSTKAYTHTYYAV